MRHVLGGDTNAMRLGAWLRAVAAVRRPCAFNLHLLTCAACALLRRCRSLLLY